MADQGMIDKLVGKVNERYSSKKDDEVEGAPLWENTVVFDTNMTTLENMYYWIIDFMNGYYSGKVEKVVDTFTTSPGSNYFGNLSITAQKMQEEGMKILGVVNNVIKSIVSLTYDLRNFDMRLKVYDKLKDSKTREEGILSLKEIWMNSTDLQRGLGSINSLSSQQYGFTTLRPAFMAAESVEHAKSLDLNEMVKRILIARVGEFFTWVQLSESELRKRYEIERSQLKSQIDTVKIYSSWVRPYLLAAEQLRMKESKEASIVSVFSQMILELQLLGKKEVNVGDYIVSKDLPEGFKKKIKEIRKFNEILTVQFKFRAYPTQQHPHAGRVEITFRAYVLNEDELLLLEKLREDSDVESMLNVSKTLTDKSLEQLKEDIEYFIEKPKKEEKTESEYFFEDIWKDFKKTVFGQSKEESAAEKKKKAEEKENALKEKKNVLKNEGVPQDAHEETVVRNLAELDSSKSCFTIFDSFKKTNGLATFPNPFDNPDVIDRVRMRIAEIQAGLKK